MNEFGMKRSLILRTEIPRSFIQKVGSPTFRMEGRILPSRPSGSNTFRMDDLGISLYEITYLWINGINNFPSQFFISEDAEQLCKLLAHVGTGWWSCTIEARASRSERAMTWQFCMIARRSRNECSWDDYTIRFWSVVLSQIQIVQSFFGMVPKFRQID